MRWLNPELMHSLWMLCVSCVFVDSCSHLGEAVMETKLGLSPGDTPPMAATVFFDINTGQLSQIPASAVKQALQYVCGSKILTDDWQIHPLPPGGKGHSITTASHLFLFIFAGIHFTKLPSLSRSCQSMKLSFPPDNWEMGRGGFGVCNT